MKRIAFIVAAGLSLAAAVASAQSTSNAKVVAACGTPPFTYSVGLTVSLLVDTTGSLCGSGGGGGGGAPGLAQGSTTSGQLGPLVQGAVVTGTSAYTNATTQPLNLTAAGALKVSILGISGNSVAQGFSSQSGATTSGIGVSGVFNTAAPTVTSGNAVGLQINADGSLISQGRPITPIVSAAAENNHVLKGSAGNLISVNATNLTATAGFLVVLNATAAPADGAITPLACQPLPANGSASIAYGSGPPGAYSTGITAVLTSATTCFTKTTGTLTGFISGQVQ